MAYIDKLDGKISEEFWGRKAAEWRFGEQQVKVALDDLTTADLGDRALDAQRVLELANKAYLLYLSQDSAEKGQTAQNAVFIDTPSISSSKGPK